MAIMWETACIEYLRVALDDLSTTPTYEDTKLKKLLIIAAFQVNTEATFVQDFNVNIVEQSITPDPADTTSGDETFVNLMCLKALCIMDRGAATKAAGKAISGKDMNALQFDLTGVASSTLALLAKGWCAVYDESLTDYVYGNNSIGRAVMGPIRQYSRGYYTYSTPRE